MKRAKPDADLAKWCAALVTAACSETVPEGWLTVRQLAAMLGKSPCRAGELLREAVATGRCERQNFRVPAAGTVRPVPHYKLK